MDPEVSHLLREALHGDPRPRKEIALRAKIHPVTLSQFASGAKGINDASARRLAAALGYRVKFRLEKIL